MEIIFKFSGYYPRENKTTVRAWRGKEYLRVWAVEEGVRMANKEGAEFNFDADSFIARFQALKDQIDKLFPTVRPLPTDYAKEMKAIANVLVSYCGVDARKVAAMGKGYING